jgi:hypothetical protein
VIPFRLFQSDGVIVDGIRAPILEGGALGQWQRWAYMDAEGGAEMDAVAEEGHLYLLSCGQAEPLPPMEEGRMHLPLLLEWKGRTR